MKYALLFVLISHSLLAQTTTKSFVLGADQVTYFEITRTTDDSGNYYEFSKTIGPASSLAKDQADKIDGSAIYLANKAVEVSFTNKRIAEFKAADATILQVSGISPLSLIQSKYLPDLTKPGWTIDAGSGFVPLVFTVNAQGVLRYSVNGASTKSAEIYGSIIRLNSFPSSGLDTDFFATENSGRYFSLPNRLYVIKKP